MENNSTRLNDMVQKTHPKHMGNKRKMPRFKMTILSIVGFVVVAAVVVGGLYWMRTANGTGIDSNKYQAVFLTSGQVYFGKLNTSDGSYSKLTDVFYIQAKTNSDTQNPQDGASSTDLQLIKLGAEVHGPEDEMIISKDQVLFYENLKTDGKVATSIKQYYDQKK